jgi:hypothetical protein
MAILVSGCAVHISVGARPSSPPPPTIGAPEAPGSTEPAPRVDGRIVDHAGRRPVDPAEAARVAERLWTAHVVARELRDVAMMTAAEAGPVLDADRGYACLAGCRGNAPTLDGVAVDVPRQVTWPMSFLAVAQYTTRCDAPVKPCEDLFVAEQESSGAPWRIVFWTTFAGPDSLSTWGGSEFAPPVGAQTYPGRRIVGEWAHYLQSYRDAGTPPSPTIIASGVFSSGFAESIYEPIAQQQRDGEHRETRYDARSSDPVWTFSLPTGTSITCGTVRYVDHTDALAGRTLVQGTDFQPFGGGVRPGRYRSLVFEGVHMSCYQVDPATRLVHVLGMYGDDTRVTTVPAT